MFKFPDFAIDLDLSEMVHEPVLTQKELSIRVGKQQDSTMVQTKVGVHRSVIVASPAYLTTHGNPASLDECLQHRLIDKRHPARLMGWEGLLPSKQLLNAAKVFATDDLQAQSDAIVTGWANRPFLHLTGEHECVRQCTDDLLRVAAGFDVVLGNAGLMIGPKAGVLPFDIASPASAASCCARGKNGLAFSLGRIRS